MAENDAPYEPPNQPEPWATAEPTTTSGQVMGVRTHTGHASFSDEPMRRTSEHLRLLGILSYVYGGLQGIGVLFGLIYAAIGLVFVFNPPGQGSSQGGPPPPDWFGWLFVGAGVGTALVAATLMTLTFLSARDLMRHRRRVFCIIVAATHCINIPLGLVLAIFTFIVLNKPEAKALFERNSNDLCKRQ